MQLWPGHWESENKPFHCLLLGRAAIDSGYGMLSFKHHLCCETRLSLQPQFITAFGAEKAGGRVLLPGSGHRAGRLPRRGQARQVWISPSRPEGNPGETTPRCRGAEGCFGWQVPLFLGSPCREGVGCAPSWVQGGRTTSDGRVTFFFLPLLSLLPFLSPKTAGLSWVSPLLWSMAFYSYVIAFPNSCRAKSHGLHRGGTPPSRHLCKPHGLLIPF